MAPIEECGHFPAHTNRPPWHTPGLPLGTICVRRAIVVHHIVNRPPHLDKNGHLLVRRILVCDVFEIHLDEVLVVGEYEDIIACHHLECKTFRCHEIFSCVACLHLGHTRLWVMDNIDCHFHWTGPKNWNIQEITKNSLGVLTFLIVADIATAIRVAERQSTRAVANPTNEWDLLSERKDRPTRTLRGTAHDLSCDGWVCV